MNYISTKSTFNQNCMHIYFIHIRIFAINSVQITRPDSVYIPKGLVDLKLYPMCIVSSLLANINYCSTAWTTKRFPVILTTMFLVMATFYLPLESADNQESYIKLITLQIVHFTSHYKKYANGYGFSYFVLMIHHIWTGSRIW